MAERVSFDALLTFALVENGERELAAMPTAAALKSQYPDTGAWDARLWAALPRKRQMKHPLRLLRMAVVTAAVMIAILACALMVSAEVRYAVKRAILEWTDTHLQLTYATEGTPEKTVLPDGYSDHYVPDGFVLDTEGCLDLTDTFFHPYTSVEIGENGQALYYSVDCYLIQPDGQVEDMDNEHTTYSTVLMNDINATLGTSNNEDGSVSYYLFWDKNDIHCTVHGNLSLNEILAIAKGIY